MIKRMSKRPWGNYRILLHQPGIQVKRIEIKKGCRFSLQKHFKRAEKWIVISGRGLATLGTQTLCVKPGSFLNVPKGCIHRLQSTGTASLILIEVQFGKYLGEDDILRLADDFGRL